MNVAFEEQMLALTAEFKKSLKALSLPSNTLGALDKIPESEEDKRSQFIKKKFEAALETLEAPYCVIPSILGIKYFTLVLKMGDKIKKLTGGIKEGFFEIQPNYDQIIKAKTLNECIERVVLFFEKQAAMPIIFESHRNEVESNARKTLEEAIVNKNFEKIKALFDYLNLKEIDEEIFLKALKQSSKEIIEYLIKKIDQHELRFRQMESNEYQEKENFETILKIARSRAARPSVISREITKIIFEYLKKHHPMRFTEEVFQTELKIYEFLTLIAELSVLNKQGENFHTERELIEKKLLNLMESKQLTPCLQGVLNSKMGSANVFVLDIALGVGTPALVKKLLALGAKPTVGWQYENLENFEQNPRSVLRYQLSKRFLPESELKEIYDILREFLAIRAAHAAMAPDLRKDIP